MSILVPQNSPNRLGWLTDLTIRHQPGMIDVTSFLDSAYAYIKVSERIKLDMTIEASSTPAMMELLQEWMRNGLSSPVYEHEFACLYCGSPNSIELTHCKKCGAPRSFIIG